MTSASDNVGRADTGQADASRVDESQPRILCEAEQVLAEAGQRDDAGAVWRLQPPVRDLDSNVIRLRPGDGIASHAGPDLDVLLAVLDGSGSITAGDGTRSPLRRGTLVWLPRLSRREIAAGPDGLAYLTVHRRRQSLVVQSGPPS